MREFTRSFLQLLFWCSDIAGGVTCFAWDGALPSVIVAPAREIP